MSVVSGNEGNRCFWNEAVVSEHSREGLDIQVLGSVLGGGHLRSAERWARLKWVAKLDQNWRL